MTDSTFVHLRVHSAFSLSEGAIKINELAERCSDEKMSAVAITDTNNLFGALQFSTYIASKGVQPIIGCLLKVKAQQDGLAKHSRPTLDSLPLLAKNEIGYKNLIKLSSMSWKRACDEGEAFLELSDFDGISDGIIALTGAYEGIVGRLLAQGQKIQAKEELLKLSELFNNRLYVEISRTGLAIEANIEDDLIELAYELNLPLVATNAAFFLDEKMHEAHDALLCVAESRYVSEQNRRKVSRNNRFKSAIEMHELFSDLPEAIINTAVIAKRCAYMVRPHAPMLPRFPGENSEATELRTQAVAGLKTRLEQQVITRARDENEKIELTRQYEERLEYELKIINQMGYDGYFLIVSDFIKWAKANNIPVGPGRGSGAGSLVAWSLTITDVDPILYSLIFERFLNPERVSMPDFDVDFCQDRRDEVISYVQRRYGYDRVAQIITFGKFQARMVVRDVGRVLQMSYGQVDKLCKLIPNNPANPVTLSEAIATEFELSRAIKSDPNVSKLMDIGQKLEGLYRHASTHAAGVVISDKALVETSPMYYDPKSAMPVTQFNMKDAEIIGLVKFDFLGLKTLTVIQKTIDMLKSRGVHVDLLKIPMDDQRTFELLQRCETTGVFQFESGGMVDVIRQLKPSKFEELIAIVALYRPGPMDDIPRYIACKNGLEPVVYQHPMLEPILKETYGVMVYQEQVMQIAQIMGGYTLGAADLLRRAMGKKIKSEMDMQRAQFVDGAVANGVSDEIANQIFDSMAKFAGYGFNKSHSAPYALIAYQTAYMKANYPLEYMASVMTYDMASTDKLCIFKQELEKMGIPLLSPDINRSGVNFSVDEEGQGVRYGLAAIKNVGSGSMESIIAERKTNGQFRDIWDFVSRVDSRQLNKRQLENLIIAGAFDCLDSNRACLHKNVELLLNVASQATQERQSTQTSLFANLSNDAMPKISLAEVPPWTSLERAQKEFDSIGFYLSSHPLDGYVEELTSLKVLHANKAFEFFQRNDGGGATLAGVILNVSERTSKSGQRYAFVGLSDWTGAYEVVLFSEQLSRFKSILNPGATVILDVTGKIDGEGVRLTVNSISSLGEKLSTISSLLTLEASDVHAAKEIKVILDSCQRQGGAKVILSVKTAFGHADIVLGSDYIINDDARNALNRFIHFL